MPIRELQRRGLVCFVWAIAAGLPTAAHAASAAEQELRRVLSEHPNTTHGKMLFDTCAACHQSDGAGTRDGTIPAIAAQPFGVIARALVEYRYDKRWDERMQHFTDEHHLQTAEDISDVAGYISSLPATHSLGQGGGANVPHGGKLYARSCASCHGPIGEGDVQRFYPRLAGQHYQYLLRELIDASRGRRPDFPAQHIHLLQTLRQSDLAAVADYLSRLGP